MEEHLAPEVAEQSPLLREERAAAPAQEPSKVPAVAFVCPRHLVPETPVLLAKVRAVHGRILQRGRVDPARLERFPQDPPEGGHGIFPAW